MSSATSSEPAPQSGPRLKRALGLWDLVFYGIILIQPTAPMPPFGVVSQVAHGHVVTTVLIAMVAMLFTAISYGRMARAYPSAGSAYTYVGREINSSLGFVTGWSLAMDSILNPIICTIWCSKAAINAGDLVTLTLLNVSNPPAETIGDFALTTSADVVPAYAAPYSIGVAVNPGVVVSVNPTSTGALASYVISNLRASAELTAGTSTITIHGPKGTVFPGLANDYALEDSTHSESTGTAKTIVGGGGTNNVQLDVPTDIAAGDTLSITIQEVINPATSSSNYAIDIVGGVVGPTPTSSTTSTTGTTTTTAPPPTTTTPRHRVQPQVLALSASAKVRGHAFRLWLSCSKATCSGWLRVYDGRAQLAAYHYRNLRPGHQWGYLLRLSQKGFNMLNRSKHHSIRVEQAAFVYGGRPATRALTLHR